MDVIGGWGHVFKVELRKRWMCVTLSGRCFALEVSLKYSSKTVLIIESVTYSVVSLRNISGDSLSVVTSES